MSLSRVFLSLFAIAASAVVTQPARAEQGPYAVERGFYQFVNRSEQLVATDRKVDIWSEVYRPKTGAKNLPLLVFLHGNHGTCGRYDEAAAVRIDSRSDYTDTGACPKGYVVTPNHLGYTYLANELASWGYLVVSINANRGITSGSGVSGDRGLNLMRGRLVLRHLALLSDWNRGKGDIAPPATLGFDPKGSIDFSQVGLMGHSRGGEGVRAALQQYRDVGNPFKPLIEPLSIRSIFEIGPIDGQTDRQLDADGVNSMILLPGCDGDVYDLQGMKVFDRVFTRTGKTDTSATFHGTFLVWGANHNAYNTEWLTSDANGCRGSNQLFPASGTSSSQQITALESMVPFFRATVGKNAKLELAGLFDPNVRLSPAITGLTNVDRGYLPGPINDKTVVLEKFTGDTGVSDAGVPTTAAGVKVVHQAASFEHDPSTRVATVNWEAGAPDTRFFQVSFGGNGRDLSAYRTFAFRTALRCFGSICNKAPSNKGEMNFKVALVGKAGKLSDEAATSGRVRISRPTGPNLPSGGSLHSALYTVQIPFSDFGGVDLKSVAGVRFIFEDKPQGSLDITDLTASIFEAASDGAGADLVMASERSEAAPAAKAAKAAPAASPAADGNRLKIVRGGDRASAGKGAAARAAPAAGEPTVDIVLTSKRVFPVTGSFPKLTVGDRTIEGGEISADGLTMTIRVPASTFEALDKTADVSLFVQSYSPVWKFGPLSR